MLVSDIFVRQNSRKWILSGFADSVIIIGKLFNSFGELLSSLELTNSKIFNEWIVNHKWNYATSNNISCIDIVNPYITSLGSQISWVTVRQKHQLYHQTKVQSVQLQHLYQRSWNLSEMEAWAYKMAKDKFLVPPLSPSEKDNFVEIEESLRNVRLLERRRIILVRKLAGEWLKVQSTKFVCPSSL